MAEKDKAAKQAETARRIREAQEYQKAHANADDEDIENLLGNIPDKETKRRSLQKKDEKLIKPPIIRSLNQPLVYFKNKAGKTIIGPGQKYYVVRDEDGKLHYKEASQVIFLEENWQPGDPVPGFESPKFEVTMSWPKIDDEDEDLLG